MSFKTCLSSERSVTKRSETGFLFLQLFHPPSLIQIQSAILFAPAVIALIRIPLLGTQTPINLPCAIDTSIWRSNVTICSALNRFFGMTFFLSKTVSIKPLGPKKPSQVSSTQRMKRIVDRSAAVSPANNRIKQQPLFRT